MFLFGPNDRAEIEDFRPQVHDSDGLMMLNGRGEELWRPLANPHNLQVSAFADTNPRSFGLVQRDKDYMSYQDLESNYQKRPSLIVEPIGDWGEGEVVLFEIPSKQEIHDNIAAFWRPKAPAAAKSEHIYTYRLHWGPDIAKTDALARFTRTGVSAQDDGSKLFVLELAGERLKALDAKAVEGRRHGRQGRHPQHRRATQPRDRRLAAEFSGRRQGSERHRTARPSERERDRRVRDLDLSMDGVGVVATPYLPAESPLALAPGRLGKPAQPSRAPIGGPLKGRRLFVIAATVVLAGGGVARNVRRRRRRRRDDAGMGVARCFSSRCSPGWRSPSCPRSPASSLC